jgi:beta-xylosidase
LIFRFARIAALLGLTLQLAATTALPCVAQTASSPESRQAHAAPPKVDAPLLLPDMPLHDPWIVADKPTQTYYLYTSNVGSLTGVQSTGTMVYTSRDLKHWTRPKVVFVPTPAMFAHDGGWAPEVHPWHGRWYLFTTFHNEAKPIPQPLPLGHTTYMRGTITAVSDTLEGPFHALDPAAPVAPADFMTLDGTLYVDPAGKPWMVYAHEWMQTTDGMMEAVPLKDDLSGRAGDPIHLFKASDAPWLDAEMKPSTRGQRYVTDGPELYRTHDGHLLMLWSSYEASSGTHGDSYVETAARSRSGKIEGPWEQLPVLLKQDSGHGMLFHAFDGTLMMVVHRPFHNARGKLYEMRDAGDHLELGRERTDLDGDASAGGS